MEPKLPNKTLLSTFFDSKVTVELLAGSQLQSVALRLMSGHGIRFRGSLSSPSVGGAKTIVELTSLECLSCHQSDGDQQTTTHQSGDIPSYTHAPESVWPDVATFAASALQGASDFILPHFIRLNVTQLF